MAPNRRGHLKLRTRILAGVLASILVAFAAVGVVATAELHRYLLDRTDTTLRTILDLTQPRLDRLLPRAEAGQQFPRLQRNLGDYYLAFASDRGSTVILRANPELTPQLPADPTALAPTAAARDVPSASGHDELRLQARRVDGGVLLAATSLEQINQTIGRLQLVITAASAIALMLATLSITITVRRGLRPLETMATEADRITAGDLTKRVHSDTSEVGRLGAALNGMLARIEAALREREANQHLMRQFFADASHELRNPLATVRANAELYQQGALRDTSQLDKAMRHIGLEARRMSRLVDDMLRLAQLDQSPEPRREPVDLTALVGECLRRARATAPERAWRAHIDPNLTTFGDEELLGRAIDNLITNVQVHTPADTIATVTASQHDHMVVIEVSDNGPGVAADSLPNLFQRFYRAPTHGHHTGSGLGLAIVAQTARVLGGNATVTLNKPHGLRVALILPTQP